MLDLREAEKEVLSLWQKRKIYEKVKAKNAKGKKFYFLQGPPYTSGKLHIGHAWNNSMKDMILRYKRMKGFNVWDRAGYDMHGLPTENAVQKKLGLKTKEDIAKFGVGKFVKACQDFSLEQAGYMNEDLWKLGVWLDHENAYMPIKKEFIDGEIAFFKKAWEQKRLYRGVKVMHWDSETETSLAKHELEYHLVKDTSIFLKFKRKEGENEYFVVWTTTPWTIPFNLAVMVHPEVDYVKAKVDNEYWIVAKDLAGVFISGLLGKKLEIVAEFKGSELEGQEYIHPLHSELKGVYSDLKKEYSKAHTIILSKEYVDTSAGTGLVHCAPGCGPEDQEVARLYGIGAFNTLNERGEFENMGKFTGWQARADDKKFIEEFDKVGALVAKTEVEHEYPHSWRSHKPVVFRTTEQWFLKTENLVPRLLRFNEKVGWVPKKSGESYNRWTQNLKDNSVTRQRFWGCPVPIWQNVEDPEDYIVVGSVAELEKYAGKKLDDLSLHKPWVDDIVIKKGKKTYKRIPDVVDVWIDSGTASWNCLYNDPALIKEWFPADLVLEATEQTRLWFSMLQICSSIMFNKGCYKNVFAHGMILDYQGVKMSKSLGNIISPYEVIDKYSVDILRYYICQVNAGVNISFSWEDVKVKQRNLLIFANIANYILDLESQKIPKGRPGVEEAWILSKYNSTLQRVSDLFEAYRLDETIGEIEDLFISLSRDYIKFVRDKATTNSAVLETIKEVYLGILKMFSTVCPFITESLWQRLNQKEESIHLCDWPKSSKRKINENLEKEFGVALEIIERGLAERDRAKIGLKWPLAKATISVPEIIGKELQEIVKGQLNIKDFKIIKGDKIKVELDTKMTPELEAEGYAREISRKVQALRKKAGLVKADNIELTVGSEIDLSSQAEMIKERTNSKTVIIEKKLLGKLESSEDFKVKEKKFSIGFNKL